jgi:PAS domain S-box-containing protein
MLASAMRDGQGNVTAMMGSFIDLTARKRAEEERARLAAVLDATPDVVGISDPSGNVLYLNQAARTMFGLSDAAPLGKMGDHHAPASRSVILETAIPSAVKTGAWRGETNLVDPSGREVPFSQVIIAHRGPDGAPLYFATIARDISEQRELEAQLRQAQKMEAIGRLAGGVAHDFNNLLSVILSFARIVHDDLPEGHPSRPELEQIERAGERAADLTRQMLAFSRKQVLQPRVVDANDVLLAMAPMIERLVGEDLELQLALAATPCLLKVDPPQLEQAVLNLVVNARDAMPSGGRLTIETSLVEIDESYARTHLDVRPGPHVLIAVSDTGIGMDAATKERIFEPFFTTKGPGIGTGLGLSSVFGIVRQTGGTIWVYSEPGRGTTFKLYFPRTADPAMLLEPARRVAPMGSLRGRTVMVVEDEAQLRDVVVSVLRRAGLVVLEAAHPDDALALAAAHDGPIDLLLTDVVMPKLNGKQLADRLLATRPTTRVVYMSGYTENTIVHHGVLDAGVDFLPKPVVPDALLAIVQRILGGASGP